jgi:sugar phosphate isomerase/epimerase
MLKFSCADFTFPVPDRLTALKLIRLLGFTHVDMGLFARSDHFSPLELDASPQTYMRQIRQDLDEAGLRASDVFLQIGLEPAASAANDPDANTRRQSQDIFLRAVELAVGLECKHITGLPGVFHDGVERRRDRELAAHVTAWRSRKCAEAGLVYGIEPHLGSVCDSVEQTHNFLRMAEGLTLTLDYGHFITAGEDSSQVHTLLPHASHLHARGGAVGRLQAPLAENTIDFAGMVGRLLRQGYPGFVALEYVWIDWEGCNRADNVSETILLRRLLSEAAASGERSGLAS